MYFQELENRYYELKKVTYSLWNAVKQLEYSWSDRDGMKYRFFNKYVNDKIYSARFQTCVSTNYVESFTEMLSTLRQVHQQRIELENECDSD